MGKIDCGIRGDKVREAGIDEHENVNNGNFIFAPPFAREIPACASTLSFS